MTSEVEDEDTEQFGFNMLYLLLEDKKRDKEDPKKKHEFAIQITNNERVKLLDIVDGKQEGVPIVTTLALAIDYVMDGLRLYDPKTFDAWLEQKLLQKEKVRRKPWQASNK